MVTVEVGNELRVNDKASGNPRPLLRAVALPVDQILHAPSFTSGVQEVLHSFKLVCILSYKEEAKWDELGEFLVQV